MAYHAALSTSYRSDTHVDRKRETRRHVETQFPEATRRCGPTTPSLCTTEQQLTCAKRVDMTLEGLEYELGLHS